MHGILIERQLKGSSSYGPLSRSMRPKQSNHLLSDHTQLTSPLSAVGVVVSSPTPPTEKRKKRRDHKDKDGKAESKRRPV